MNAFIFITTALLLLTLQAHLPALGWLGGLRLELLPCLVACGALTLRRGGALLLALGIGFAQDSLSAGPFGISALVYGVGTIALSQFGEALDRDMPLLQVGTGALLAALTAVAACTSIGFSFWAVPKIVLVAATSGIMTPVIFLAVDFVRYWGRAA